MLWCISTLYREGLYGEEDYGPGGFYRGAFAVEKKTAVGRQKKNPGSSRR